jgi:predicted ATPase
VFAIQILVCDRCGGPRQILGSAAVDEALEMAHETGELGWEAEMHRLRGELLLAASELGGAGSPGAAGVPGRAEPPCTGRVPDAAEGEACLVRALEIARRQAAKSLELRAATSLGRLWQRRGERRAAVDLLAPVYWWFTEGLDTADLTEAKALLEELG